MGPVLSLGRLPRAPHRGCMNTVRSRESSIEWASAREAYQAPIRALEAELAKNRAAARALLEEQTAVRTLDDRIVTKKSYYAFTVASDVAQQALAAEFDVKTCSCTLDASAVREQRAHGHRVRRIGARRARMSRPHRGECPRALAAVVSTVLEVRSSLEAWHAREGERSVALPDGNRDPKGGASTEHSRR